MMQNFKTIKGGIDMRPEEREKWLKQITLIRKKTEELKKLNDNKGDKNEHL